MNFPAHKCGLFLTHNEHRDYYETVESYLNTQTNFGAGGVWKDEESKARAIATNELWELQWYPHTPISSYKVCAPTLEELLMFANSIAP